MADLSLKIPASSANLGLGFDSIGVAVDKFLYIEANLSDTFKVSFKDFALSVLPSDEKNLVFTTARNIAKNTAGNCRHCILKCRAKFRYRTDSVHHRARL